MDRRNFMASGALGAIGAAVSTVARAQPPLVQASVDVTRTNGPLNHIWSDCAGSDRAATTLREEWRKDLDRWKAEAGLKRVRFHGIFNDELGVHAPSILSRSPTAPPNFQNVDRVYDGLVERGVHPFVELSFMPKRLASGDRTFGFYSGNISPPSSLDAWSSFITQFTAHLVDRYGLATVRQWPFEIWNEPNLPFFWSGTQAQYFELYKATATAVKSVDRQIQVGGPATATAGWIPEFLSYCSTNNAPVDFVSSHVYAGDNQKELFGAGASYAQSDVIPEAVKRMRAQVDASAFRDVPFLLTEWSSDSPAMIAHIIKGCLPYAQGMSQWTMSGAFEELGVPNFVLKEGDKGWGMLVKGIALPSFNTYRLLNALGHLSLPAEGPVLASRRGDHDVVALVWNLAEVKQPSGIPGMTQTRQVQGAAKTIDVQFTGARRGQKVKIRYVDQERGSPMTAWRKMGSPQYPRLDQLDLLRKAAEIPAAETARLNEKGVLSITLPPEGVALIEWTS